LLFALNILEREMKWAEALLLLDEAVVSIPEQRLRWLSRKPEVFANSGDLRNAIDLADRVILEHPQAESLSSLEPLYRNRARWTAALYDNCLKTKKLFEVWASAYADRLEERPEWSSDAAYLDPSRKLRIGYVSGDLKNHPVRFFVEGYLAHRNRSDFEVHAFMTMPPDLVSENLKMLFDHWHDVANETDDNLLRIVRDRKIDILIDLSGHTVGNRLKVFARRASPVQVTWFGFLPTLGMRAMDWRLSDLGISPLGTDNFYTEKLFRLKCSITYTPPINCDAIYPAPWKKNGYVTLACLNHSRKLSDEVLHIWCDVLLANANAALLLIGEHRNSVPDESDLGAKLKAMGFPQGRVTIVPRLNLRAFMNLGSIADFAVDPFPMSGGTTTLHSLWMGLPIIALGRDGAGGEHGGASATLRGCGLEHWVARDTDEYRFKISEFIQNPESIDEARLLARPALRNSPLMDYRSRTLELENAYRQMWRLFLSDYKGA
jgi:predicted O-linked N-acetylglucosamine transferase (SPINDLY family)